jgi:hypothetical protein
MKFSLAFSTLALTVSFSAAFAPQKAFARRPGLAMSAVETPVNLYTFAKSEEIFAEAKEVGSSSAVDALSL